MTNIMGAFDQPNLDQPNVDWSKPMPPFDPMKVRHGNVQVRIVAHYET